LRPGTTVDLVVKGPTVENVLILPRQAVFEQDGKTVVYVRNGAAFASREVKVLHRSESRVVIDGLDEGVEVALIRPDGAGDGAVVTAGPAAPAASTAAPAAPGGR
jgi:hypothetical protein